MKDESNIAMNYLFGHHQNLAVVYEKWVKYFDPDLTKKEFVLKLIRNGERFYYNTCEALEFNIGQFKKQEAALWK